MSTDSSDLLAGSNGTKFFCGFYQQNSGMHLGLDLQLFADEEKTEEATPHRRQEVRKKGQVAKSADVTAAAVLTAVILFLFFYKVQFINSFFGLFNSMLQDLMRWDMTEENLKFLVEDSSIFFLRIMVPVFLLAGAVGVASNLAQVGLLFAPQVVQPKLENINPAQGIKRMFSKRSLVELLKALLKVVLVGGVVYFIIRGQLVFLLGLTELRAWDGFLYIAGLAFRIALSVLVVFASLAVADYLFQRYEFNRNISMSKYEIKQEMKQTEGDPHLKAKLKERQRQMSSRRMMQSIPEATVVITNPTHLAVALKYQVQASRGAPEVVAKGAGTVAERIKLVAAENNVPVVENKPLARMLFQTVEIGQEIPAELYQAVAEVLAFVYRLRQRG